MRVTRRDTAALLLLALPGAGPRMVTDARGRKVAIGPAKRIVSVGGTITETLYDLGASARIVAVDTTSNWPERALHEKKSVGYMRMLSSEGIVSVAPDLILAMNDAGPPAALDQLQASRVPLVYVDATPSPAAILGRTRFLADLVDMRSAGEALCATIDAGFRTLAAWRAAHPVGRRVLFVMRVTGGRIMAAGRTNAILAMEGERLLGFGPRTPDAALELAHRL